MSRPMNAYEYDSTKPLPDIGTAIATGEGGVGVVRKHGDGRYSIWLETDLHANAIVPLHFTEQQGEQERFLARHLETPSGLALLHLGVARFNGQTGYLCAYGDVATGSQLIF